ncbi:MAG: transposase, partial [Sphingobacteriales bacterium]|nr:transposase [Sphingobacteriales bacterium]
DELLTELEGFMWRYNYERRHSALSYETPLDKLKKIANLFPEL